MAASISTDTEKSLIQAFPRWKAATWEDYLSYRDADIPERVRLFFYQNHLLIDMGAEGINHATVSDLFTLLLGFWFSHFPEQIAASFGRCLLEKANTQAAAPDLVLYIGEGVPQWQQGEPRRIDLNRWRVPDLVGEISDTTLATDLDEKKKLYADLAIPEYWVVNIQGRQVFAFRLQENGQYQQCHESVALSGLPIDLLAQTLERLSQGSNISAALWFSQQIANLNAE
jgi:Uma2 family endonuclease